MNGFAVGLSIFAAAFSAAAFVMLPREGAFRNWGLLSVLLLIPLLITPLLWHVFVPLYTRLGIRSVYEYLSIRFHPRLRRLGAVLFFGYAFGWLGSMLYTLVLIPTPVIGLSQAQFLLNAGGDRLGRFSTPARRPKGSIWLDVLQAITRGGCVGPFDAGAQPGRCGCPPSSRGAANGKSALRDLRRGSRARPALVVLLAFSSICRVHTRNHVQRYLSMSARKSCTRPDRNASSANVCLFLFMLTGTVRYVLLHARQVRFPSWPARIRC
jgi:hypothetical protein